MRGAGRWGPLVGVRQCHLGWWAKDSGRARIRRMRTFPVVLRPGEDGWIVVECPVLPGCVSQGKNRDEALANIREAIALCLEAGDVPRGELVDVTVAA